LYIYARRHRALHVAPPPAINATDMPAVTLNNGVKMPMLSLGTWQYSSSVAETTVKLGLKLGITHIDTANDYQNQDGVGKALAGVARSSYFLTTKVPPQESARSAYDGTTKDLEANLRLLDLDHVDLVLLHYPPRSQSCTAMQEAWRAMEDFYAAGKAKAIGVSNYCISSFECVLAKAKVVPSVNQIQFHVGMGTDPIGVKSYADGKKIVTQAYSPLGNGGSELITGKLVSGIGAKYGKSGAAVSLHWLKQHGVPLSTKSTEEKHLADDLDAVAGSWDLGGADLATLDAATSPSSRPSFICTK